MIDEGVNKVPKKTITLNSQYAGFLGLSPNLWRVAFVLAISQLSISLWSWEFSIFLNDIIEPWQMGLVFSLGTFAALVGSILSGIIADFVGRKWTLATAFIPMFLGLITLSYLPIWPLIPLQYGLVWYGMTTIRIMLPAIPSDEIVSNDMRNPAKKILMMMMPLLFADGIGPLLGGLMLSSGFSSHDLHRIAAFSAIAAFIAASLIVKESLGKAVIEKAKAGPIISFRQLSSDFWKLVVGMVIFYFCWNTTYLYLGVLCVDTWGVDKVTFGLTRSTFSLTGAIIVYFAGKLAEKNLKLALTAAVAGNCVVFITFGLGSGTPLLFFLYFFWAFPWVLWMGSEKSIIVLSVSEETKGRALGSYQVIMSLMSIAAASFGALLWTTTGSIRFLLIFSGIGMLCSLLLLIPILKSLEAMN
jgi:predicted MFS family arabinose efflux permease